MYLLWGLTYVQIGAEIVLIAFITAAITNSTSEVGEVLTNLTQITRRYGLVVKFALDRLLLLLTCSSHLLEHYACIFLVSHDRVALNTLSRYLLGRLHLDRVFRLVKLGLTIIKFAFVCCCKRTVIRHKVILVTFVSGCEIAGGLIAADIGIILPTYNTGGVQISRILFFHRILSLRF